MVIGGGIRLQGHACGREGCGHRGGHAHMGVAVGGRGVALGGRTHLKGCGHRKQYMHYTFKQYNDMKLINIVKLLSYI